MMFFPWTSRASKRIIFAIAKENDEKNSVDGNENEKRTRREETEKRNQNDFFIFFFVLFISFACDALCNDQ